ncbi:MAG: Protein-L-isoaspartate O-methyltransferase [Candidatus Ozemobacter sibiricus]|jgi:protein-L-isoaspartate(D-aspartate) O-methyltransferase|uniref:Protein-L-isoaspartate O-methyltransferase n=1 Tax=Candidatus Ozemobacter sibiricus TaxID=2268124 RepID=A0A367ZRP3_9BACT|nr:MAG: Protein-L-isoaspartate O-methyltransferase [Candidatus Ozemobacter sibiricus]
MKRLVGLAAAAFILALWHWMAFGDGWLRTVAARSGPGEDDDMHEQRAAMVQTLRAYGIRDERILTTMGRVRRHRFIPEAYRWASDPYGDHPCPIGHQQTISQPYIVAYMTERIAPQPGEKILEIGTGSGYQAAILADLGADVYSIEIIPELADHARQVLASEGFAVKVLTGDGYKGWPEHAPFDAVIVTCAPEQLPQALVDQLKDGGRMILPLGERFAQRLVILRKEAGQVRTEEDLPVRFVPMVPGKPDSP